MIRSDHTAMKQSEGRSFKCQQFSKHAVFTHNRWVSNLQWLTEIGHGAARAFDFTSKGLTSRTAGETIATQIYTTSQLKSHFTRPCPRLGRGVARFKTSISLIIHNLVVRFCRRSGICWNKWAFFQKKLVWRQIHLHPHIPLLNKNPALFKLPD